MQIYRLLFVPLLYPPGDLLSFSFFLLSIFFSLWCPSWFAFRISTLFDSNPENGIRYVFSSLWRAVFFHPFLIYKFFVICLPNLDSHWSRPIRFYSFPSLFPFCRSSIFLSFVFLIFAILSCNLLFKFHWKHEGCYWFRFPFLFPSFSLCLIFPLRYTS